MSYKIDLHTHSIISQDGGIRAEEYEKILVSGKLDYIAITDHNETSFARIMQKKLGVSIIIGEEISTLEGEIIGLFLEKTIPGGLRIEEAIASIREQNGLVYIPHPLEKLRKGLSRETLIKVKHDIDIIEVFNGRGSLRDKQKETRAFVSENELISAASSDAHCARGLGYAYSVLDAFPTRETLVDSLRSAQLAKVYAPFYTYFCPFINRLKNKIIVTSTN